MPWGHMGKWGHLIEVIGQLHTPPAVPLRNYLVLPIALEAG